MLLYQVFHFISGLQRVRPLLQASRREQAPRHEEGWYSDQETETQVSAEGERGHQVRG